MDELELNRLKEAQEKRDILDKELDRAKRFRSAIGNYCEDRLLSYSYMQSGSKENYDLPVSLAELILFAETVIDNRTKLKTEFQQQIDEA